MQHARPTALPGYLALQRGVLRSVLCLQLTLVTGCNFISAGGPTRPMILASHDITARSQASPNRLGLALVPIDATIASRASRDSTQVFSTALTRAATSDVRIGIGDVLTIMIFEAGSGGLFFPDAGGGRTGNFLQLAPQQVDHSGAITIPYAGRIQVAGLMTSRIENAIAARLAGRALEPQVVVSVTERHSNEVSVVGDVATSLRFSLDPSGERVLGAIARAGGPHFAAYESLVTVQRNGRSETALLSQIAHQPDQDIALQGGDIVYVAHEPRTFLAVGATGQTNTLSQLNRRFPFGDQDLTLADALALAGGLQDDRANPRGVFLFRHESRATLQQLGVALRPDMPDSVPTIYMLDLKQAAGFFFAGSFWMRDHDIIYVSNAPSADLAKVLDLFLPITEAVGLTRAAAR